MFSLMRFILPLSLAFYFRNMTYFNLFIGFAFFLFVFYFVMNILVKF